MDIDVKRTAIIFKAFCDENRIRILQLLKGMLLEEMNITQPTLSHHMKILCDSGIVIGHKEGKWMHYSISEAGIECAQEYLTSLKNYKEDNRNE